MKYLIPHHKECAMFCYAISLFFVILAGFGCLFLVGFFSPLQFLAVIAKEFV